MTDTTPRLWTDRDGDLWAEPYDAETHRGDWAQLVVTCGVAPETAHPEPREDVEDDHGPLTPVVVVPAAALAWGHGTVTRDRDHVEITLAAPAPPLRLTLDDAEILGDQLLTAADGERGIPDDDQPERLRAIAGIADTLTDHLTDDSWNLADAIERLARGTATVAEITAELETNR